MRVVWVDGDRNKERVGPAGVEMNIQISEQDQLKVTYSFRYLGLTIESQLSWEQRIIQLIESWDCTNDQSNSQVS